MPAASRKDFTKRKEYVRKERVGITPDPKIMRWVLDRIGPGQRFHNITHAFESGIVALQEKEKGES